MAGSDKTDFKLLAEYSADILCRFGLDKRLHYVSPSSLHILGYTPEEMMAMDSYALTIPEDIPLLTNADKTHLMPGAKPSVVAVRKRKKDGTIVWMEVSARVVRDPTTQEPIETILVMRDITERKMLEEKLSTLALTDGLTGLANRRAFDEDLVREWGRTLREGSHISLVLLDIDHFKRFNDTYGHQVGDDCLRAIAIAVKESVRVGDRAARYGGEEIAVILPNTDSAGAVEVSERVRRAIEGLKLTHEGNPEGGGVITASFGAATALARQGGTTRMPESLLQAADNALYRAKNDGRNRIATALLVASTDYSSN